MKVYVVLMRQQDEDSTKIIGVYGNANRAGQVVKERTEKLSSFDDHYLTVAEAEVIE